MLSHLYAYTTPTVININGRKWKWKGKLSFSVMQPFTICVTILLLLGVSSSWGDVSISRAECNKSRDVTFQWRIKAALKPYKGKKIKVIYQDHLLSFITPKCLFPGAWEADIKDLSFSRGIKTKHETPNLGILPLVLKYGAECLKKLAQVLKCLENTLLQSLCISSVLKLTSNAGALRTCLYQLKQKH